MGINGKHVPRPPAGHLRGGGGLGEPGAGVVVEWWIVEEVNVDASAYQFGRHHVPVPNQERNAKEWSSGAVAHHWGDCIELSEEKDTFDSLLTVTVEIAPKVQVIVDRTAVQTVARGAEKSPAAEVREKEREKS